MLVLCHADVATVPGARPAVRENRDHHERETGLGPRRKAGLSAGEGGGVAQNRTSDLCVKVFIDA